MSTPINNHVAPWQSLTLWSVQHLENLNIHSDNGRFKTAVKVITGTLFFPTATVVGLAETSLRALLLVGGKVFHFIIPAGLTKTLDHYVFHPLTNHVALSAQGTAEAVSNLFGYYKDLHITGYRVEPELEDVVVHQEKEQAVAPVVAEEQPAEKEAPVVSTEAEPVVDSSESDAVFNEPVTFSDADKAGNASKGILSTIKNNPGKSAAIALGSLAALGLVYVYGPDMYNATASVATSFFGSASQANATTFSMDKVIEDAAQIANNATNGTTNGLNSTASAIANNGTNSTTSLLQTPCNEEIDTYSNSSLKIVADIVQVN